MRRVRAPVGQRFPMIFGQPGGGGAATGYSTKNHAREMRATCIWNHPFHMHVRMRVICTKPCYFTGIMRVSGATCIQTLANDMRMKCA
eukprot:6407704-Pyramimonas_sp.AAC.1